MHQLATNNAIKNAICKILKCVAAVKCSELLTHHSAITGCGGIKEEPKGLKGLVT